MKTILVEGNIGSGKTTVIDAYMNALSSRPDYLKLTEPVDDWKSINGTNLLERLYNDAPRWASTFQSYAMLTMARQHQYSSLNKRIKLMERSIFSTRYCFIQNFYDNKTISRVEYDILDAWFRFVSESIKNDIDYIIYLRVSPPTCYNRVIERGRPEERNISLQYLVDLHNLHDNWLLQTSDFHVKVVDGECSVDEVLKRVQNVVDDARQCISDVEKQNQTFNDV